MFRRCLNAFFYRNAGVSKSFGFIKHVSIALTVGAGLGFIYKVGVIPPIFLALPTKLK